MGSQSCGRLLLYRRSLLKASVRDCSPLIRILVTLGKTSGDFRSIGKTRSKASLIYSVSAGTRSMCSGMCQSHWIRSSSARANMRLGALSCSAGGQCWIDCEERELSNNHQYTFVYHVPLYRQMRLSAIQAHACVKCRRHVNVDLRNGIGPDDGSYSLLSIPYRCRYDGSATDVNLAFTTPNTATSIDIHCHKLPLLP